LAADLERARQQDMAAAGRVWQAARGVLEEAAAELAGKLAAADRHAEELRTWLRALTGLPLPGAPAGQNGRLAGGAGGVACSAPAPSIAPRAAVLRSWQQAGAVWRTWFEALQTDPEAQCEFSAEERANG
jgi:hypothetical protein